MTVASAEVAARLAFLASTVDQQAVPELHRASYALRHAGGRIELFEEGARFARAATMDDALLVLADRLQRRVLDYLARGGWLPLRAGLATFASGRYLILGGDSARRAAVLAGLLMEGASVESGEVVLVRHGGVVGYPAPLRLEAGAAAQLGRLRHLLDDLPRLTHEGATVVAVDPARVSSGSGLRLGPVDAIVVIGPRAAEPTLISASGQQALQAVLEARIDTAVRLPAADVSEAARLVGRAPTSVLTVAEGQDIGAALDAWLSSLGGVPQESAHALGDRFV